MRINQFFQETLGANLKNPRWSWGAIDPITNRVFLRLWSDQIDQDGDIQKVQIYWKNPTRYSNGLSERLEHINAIKRAESVILCKWLFLSYFNLA